MTDALSANRWFGPDKTNTFNVDASSILLVVVTLLRLYVTRSDATPIVSIEENRSRVKTILVTAIR